ncbi:hypothetical protein B296_00020418 [Ensete ventricosum]|uniref:Band 7 domain-containing protein n=1 Tax=Ensete ventricosum TaxID=4639 RepID=A0A426Y9P3_ENSVE|nr:hypothetical protein B296_00020418 [Ensete ventricosum]
MLCCVQVEQSTVAIKESFGKFDDVLQPGCHCLPWVFGKRIAGRLSLRMKQLDVKCETKTKVRPLSATAVRSSNLQACCLKKFRIDDRDRRLDVAKTF